jgi:dihydrofolate reductase
MARLRMQASMSLDGFIAGPEQSLDDPLGKGGMQLHEWAFGLEAWRREHGLADGETTVSSGLVEEWLVNVGATVMGRNMFGGGPGPWEDGDPWTGWWGDDPPFHTPVFVLTHHPREPVAMEGGTTFHFVTAGPEAALEQAFAAADGKDVVLGGGAGVAQQYIRAGLLEELQIQLVPILLGDGERLFDGVGAAAARFECTGVAEAPGVTHLTYRLS